MLLIITEVFLYFEQSSAHLQLSCTIPLMSTACVCQADDHWMPCNAPVTTTCTPIQLKASIKWKRCKHVVYTGAVTA